MADISNVIQEGSYLHPVWKEIDMEKKVGEELAPRPPEPFADRTTDTRLKLKHSCTDTARKQLICTR